uniref:Uncharacterized protein n=1 Tax=Daphnia galeata TaxID=27404 RepID=A0A8J2WM96_9CRUS|nr:unnamed protein product [Daphnia galeata]
MNEALPFARVVSHVYLIEDVVNILFAFLALYELKGNRLLAPSKLPLSIWPRASIKLYRPASRGYDSMDER